MEDTENFSDSGSSDRSFGWEFLPDNVLLHILSYLDYRNILRAGLTCKAWNCTTQDEFLWRDLLYSNFRINRSVGLAPGKKSWLEEYKRLIYHCPSLQTEVLANHKGQVLHVSFSHNGKYFATSSKDASIIIWKSSYPATVKYSHSMTEFSWMYTQYSQFNKTDTLLLVSGVYSGAQMNVYGSGEIAVFSLEENEFQLQCRVKNKPYDIFGAWYSDAYLLSGNLHHLAHLAFTSELWLNKASQETQSELVPITNLLLRFYNINGSHIRALIVSNCVEHQTTTSLSPVPDKMEESLTEESCDSLENVGLSHGNSGGYCVGKDPFFLKNVPTSYPDLSSFDISNCSPQQSLDIKMSDSSSSCNSARESFELKDITCTEKSRSAVQNIDVEQHGEESEDLEEFFTGSENLSEIEGSTESNSSAEEDLASEPEKLLIFTTGSKTCYPHQIGFKRIKPTSFPKRMPQGPSLAERIAIREREREAQQRFEPNWLDFDAVADRFDKIDHCIDLHGHVIGMALSPDHRFLYVNNRPWPENYVIENPFEPPPIAQEIDIHVIDMTTFQEVGTTLRSHKAYTPNKECFLIFLDVSNDYVASGAEDKHGYVWDRHYGVCLAKFPHTDVVNCVAFNPQDPEMLVTTSDDNSIKIWRSKASTKNLLSKEKISSLNSCVSVAHKVLLPEL